MAWQVITSSAKYTNAEDTVGKSGVSVQQCKSLSNETIIWPPFLHHSLATTVSSSKLWSEANSYFMMGSFYYKWFWLIIIGLQNSADANFLQRAFHFYSLLSCHGSCMSVAFEDWKRFYCSSWFYMAPFHPIPCCTILSHPIQPHLTIARHGFIYPTGSSLDLRFIASFRPVDRDRIILSRLSTKNKSW